MDGEPHPKEAEFSVRVVEKQSSLQEAQSQRERAAEKSVPKEPGVWPPGFDSERIGPCFLRA